MEPLTKEEIEVFEEEINRREEFLFKHGWLKVEKTFKYPWNGQEYTANAWHDPVNNVTYPYADGYDQLTMILLKENGWRAIVEIRYLGAANSKFGIKREEWGRFQSPRTKRIYNFLEAQDIMKQDWREDIYPDECSEGTRELNLMVGDNFQGDSIETWLYLDENKKTVYKLWEG